MLDTAGGLAHWAGYENMADEFYLAAGRLHDEGTVSRDVKDVYENFDWANLEPGSGWWTTKAAEQIFINAPMMISGIGAGAKVLQATGSALKAGMAASAVMTPMESFMEAGDTYNNALKVSGGNRELAGQAAEKVWARNMALGAVTNTAGMGFALGGAKLIPAAIRGSFMKYAATKTAGMGAAALGATKAAQVGAGALVGGTGEGIQELAQNYYQDAAIEWVKGGENPDWIVGPGQLAEIWSTPEGKEAFATGPDHGGRYARRCPREGRHRGNSRASGGGNADPLRSPD